MSYELGAFSRSFGEHRIRGRDRSQACRLRKGLRSPARDAGDRRHRMQNRVSPKATKATFRVALCASALALIAGATQLACSSEAEQPHLDGGSHPDAAPTKDGGKP